MQNNAAPGTDRSQLTPRQEQLLHALLTENSIAAAAKKANCAIRTAHYWLKNPDFQEAYRLAQPEFVTRAGGCLQAASLEAVETLRCLVADPQAPAYSRVAAARFIVDSAFRARELDGLEAKVADLHRRIDEREAAERARDNYD